MTLTPAPLTATERVAGIVLRHSQAVDTHGAVGRLIHSLLLLLMGWLRGIEPASPISAAIVRAAPPPGNRPQAENPASASQPRRPPAGARIIAVAALAPPSLRRPLHSLRRMPEAKTPLPRPPRARRLFTLRHPPPTQKAG